MKNGKRWTYHQYCRDESEKLTAFFLHSIRSKYKDDGGDGGGEEEEEGWSDLDERDSDLDDSDDSDDEAKGKRKHMTAEERSLARRQK